MRRVLPSVAVAVAVAVAALALSAPPSFAGAANGGLPGAPSNPIDGMTWGTYQIASTDPSIDPPSAFYNTARNAADRAEFAKILNQPRFRWFGAWIPTLDQGGKNGARKAASSYIQEVTKGNPDIGVSIGIFRLQPFEHEACNRLPTSGEIADYRTWITEF